MSEVACNSLVCLGCGCGCEDALEIRGGRFRRAADIDCPICNDWIDRQTTRIDSCNISGRTCSLDEALAEVSTLLNKSRAPLFCGFAALVTENQRRVVRLAQATGGYLDWTTGQHQIDSIVALQRIGHVGCSLGEIKNRADLIVYWDIDVAKTAPRFSERFVRTKNILAIETSQPEPQATLESGCIHFNNRLALMSAISLRCANQLDCGQAEKLGVPTQQIDELLNRVKQSSYCVIVIHSGDARMDTVELEQLTKLVMQLNEKSQVRVVDLASQDNSRGAENVSTWLSGFPAATKFFSQKTEYDPFRYSSVQIVQNSATDLIVAFGPAIDVTDDHHHILKIEIGCCRSEPGDCRVQIPTASDFVGCGTVFRSDGVPLPIDIPAHDQRDHRTMEDVFRKLLPS